MTYEERIELFNRIVVGVTIIDYQGTAYFVYDPTPAEHVRVDAVARNIYNRLIWSGLPSEEECYFLLLEKGLWSVDDETKLKELHENLSKLRKALPELEFKSVEKRKMLEYIEVTEAAIKDMNRRKNALTASSAEYVTKLYKYKLLLMLLTKDEFNKLIWTNYEEFKRTDDSLIGHLLTKAYFNDEIDEKKLRELARSEPWRSMWLGAVKTGNLFGKPLTQLTDYQRSLVSWSILYDNVYEHPESPSQEVIDDDALLDSWLEIQADKRKSNANNNNPDGFIKSDKVKNSKEVGIIVDSIEDAKKVYSLNNAQGKDIINKRAKTIKAKGEVKELDLPDVRKEFNLEVNRLGIAGVKQRMSGG